MKWISLLFLLLSALAFQVTAQKPVALNDLTAQIKTFKNSKDFRAGYSKPANQSLVYYGIPVQQEGTYASSSTWIGLNVGFDFQGNYFDKPINNFAVFFQGLGNQWVFLKDEHLFLIADGQKFDLGKSEANGDFKKNFLTPSEYRISQSLVFRVKRSDVEKIANAKKVEIRVGVSELIYKIKPSELETIKNLLLLAETK